MIIFMWMEKGRRGFFCIWRLLLILHCLLFHCMLTWIKHIFRHMGHEYKLCNILKLNICTVNITVYINIKINNCLNICIKQQFKKSTFNVYIYVEDLCLLMRYMFIIIIKIVIVVYWKKCKTNIDLLTNKINALFNAGTFKWNMLRNC